MSEEAISYFSKYWTTHKDQCYVVEGKIEEGVKVITHQEYRDKVMREWGAKYDQWVKDGKPHIDVHTKHQDLDSSNSE